MKMKLFTDGFEGFAARSLERARRIDHGERIVPETSITFESPMEMFEVLTPQRIRLCVTARKRPYSVTALAKALRRDPKSVRRDVIKLEKAGVLRTRQQINPGHGRVKIVEPVAQSFELRARF